MELTFLTGNNDKLREAIKILGNNIKIEGKDFDIDEIQEIDGAKITVKKARDAFGLIKKPLIVEDTSLYLIAWKGLPGALIKWFLKSVGSEGITNMISGYTNRNALAQSVIAYHDGKNIRIFEGTVKGTVSEKPKGKGGFGWDDIFIPEGHNKTYAEMTDEEKSKISPRMLALEKLKKYLFNKNNG